MPRVRGSQLTEFKYFRPEKITTRNRNSWTMLKRRFSGQAAKLLSRFRGNSKGNVAVIFAIACIPILTAIGCAVDYSLAVRMRSKMQAAADAASVGAISQSSPGYAAA